MSFNPKHDPGYPTERQRGLFDEDGDFWRDLLDEPKQKEEDRGVIDRRTSE